MAEQNVESASYGVDATFKMARILGLSPVETADAVGRNVLKQELGDYGDWDGQTYHLDQETRDRLLAHGRQDAAATFTLVRYALAEARSANRIAKQNRLLLIGVLAGLVGLAMQISGGS